MKTWPFEPMNFLTGGGYSRTPAVAFSKLILNDFIEHYQRKSFQGLGVPANSSFPYLATSATGKSASNFFAARCFSQQPFKRKNLVKQKKNESRKRKRNSKTLSRKPSSGFDVAKTHTNARPSLASKNYLTFEKLLTSNEVRGCSSALLENYDNIIGSLKFGRLKNFQRSQIFNIVQEEMVNMEDPYSALHIMREMEADGLKPSKQMYETVIVEFSKVWF